MRTHRRRTEVSEELAAEVLFAADRTCCVCQDRSRPVQIHHVDDNHSNHDPDNLAALCVYCHGLTLTSGGFVRKLDSAQVRRYRQDWLSSVQHRRELRDAVSLADIRKLANHLSDVALSIAEPSELITEPLTRNTGRYYRRLEELVRKTRRGDRIAIMSHHVHTDAAWATPRARAYLQARTDYRAALIERAAAGVAYQRMLCFDCLERGEQIRVQFVRSHWLEHCERMLSLRSPSVWVKISRAYCGPDVFLINADTVAFSMEAPACRNKMYTAGALLMRGPANDRTIHQVISWWESAESTGRRVSTSELRQSIQAKNAAA